MLKTMDITRKHHTRRSKSKKQNRPLLHTQLCSRLIIFSTHLWLAEHAIYVVFLTISFPLVYLCCPKVSKDELQVFSWCLNLVITMTEFFSLF